jgi:hypothetical protein
MTPEAEQKVLASLYDRLYDAVTYSPDGKSAAFPKNIYFQMTKNTVLNPADFVNMLNPLNPTSGDQRSAEQFSAMVDVIPKPGALWSDSGEKLSRIMSDVMAFAKTSSQPSPSQLKIYQQAYDFLNKRTKIKDFTGQEIDKIDPSDIAIAYDNARSGYISAVSGYRTAYNGYDLTQVKDQRAFNAVAPALQNLMDQTWNAWGRSGKAQVEQAQAALASTINDAVQHAIEQVGDDTGARSRLPTSMPVGGPWLPSYALPTNWVASDLKGPKLTFSSAYLNKTESSQAHSYGLEGSGSYGLFHASVEVGGEYEEKHSHMDAENFTLEAELIAVNIMRPWFNPLLFGLSGWWVDGKKRNELSNGTPANPSGQIPLIPTGFVLAKNVKVTADFSQEDKNSMSSKLSTAVSGGWGPFTIKAKYGHSISKSDAQAKFDGGSLIFPGLQLIAWISTVTPASPPLDPR